MRGRKIGVIVAVVALLGMFAIPSIVSAAVTHSGSCTPSAVKWDQDVAISFVANSGAAGGWWNGTVYLVLRSPSGNSYNVSGITLTLANADANKYCNWSYDPSEAGYWNVTFNTAKASSSGIEVPDHWSSFTVERSGVWLNRTVQDWTNLVWMIFVIGAILLILVVVMNRTNREAGGSP